MSSLDLYAAALAEMYYEDPMSDPDEVEAIMSAMGDLVGGDVLGGEIEEALDAHGLTFSMVVSMAEAEVFS